MQTGFDGTSLAVFTGLAPAGMLAFCLMGMMVVQKTINARRRGESQAVDAGCVRRWMALPLLVAWLGFITSTTHLGMPSNALYVVDGIGRSPLSNEVAASVLFLFFSGVYWMYGFSQHRRQGLSAVLLCLAVAAAIVAIHLSSDAYSIETALTWNLWFTSANVWLSALMSAPLLASAAIVCSRARVPLWWHTSLLAASMAFLALGTVVLCLQWGQISGMANNVTTLVEILPNYPWTIVLRTLLCVAGVVLQAFGALADARGRRLAALVCGVAGCACMTIGLLAVRFAFYQMYLSVGF